MELKIEDFEIFVKFCDFPFDFLGLSPDLSFEEILINFILTHGKLQKAKKK